jgi:hypothetical protein
LLWRKLVSRSRADGRGGSRCMAESRATKPCVLDIRAACGFGVGDLELSGVVLRASAATRT